ncbi:hypothetical protein KR074_006167 [Drosophila pseudoananassae]|nr:hypothetical protein KR074_006167 [Drosophila pseudoananassae]
MHKGTMMGLCLMAALGAVLLEVKASPDAGVASWKRDLSQLSQFLKSPEKLNEHLQEKCKNVTGDDHGLDISLAGARVQNCLSNNLEIMEQPVSLDTLIPRLCKKAPEVKACAKEYYNQIEVCFTAEEKGLGEFIFMAGSSLLNLACSHNCQDEGGFLGGLPRWMVAAGGLGAGLFIFILYRLFSK